MPLPLDWWWDPDWNHRTIENRDTLLRTVHNVNPDRVARSCFSSGRGEDRVLEERCWRGSGEASVEHVGKDPKSEGLEAGEEEQHGGHVHDASCG